MTYITTGKIKVTNEEHINKIKEKIKYIKKSKIRLIFTIDMSSYPS